MRRGEAPLRRVRTAPETDAPREGELLPTRLNSRHSRIGDRMCNGG